MSTIDAAIINHITNNSGASNGLPSEDVLTRYEAIQTAFDDDYYDITTELNDRVLAPGNILRLRNKNGEIDSFIMVLFGSPNGLIALRERSFATIGIRLQNTKKPFPISVSTWSCILRTLTR